MDFVSQGQHEDSEGSWVTVESKSSVCTSHWDIQKEVAREQPCFAAHWPLPGRTCAPRTGGKGRRAWELHGQDECLQDM